MKKWKRIRTILQIFSLWKNPFKMKWFEQPIKEQVSAPASLDNNSPVGKYISARCLTPESVCSGVLWGSGCCVSLWLGCAAGTAPGQADTPVPTESLERPTEISGGAGPGWNGPLLPPAHSRQPSHSRMQTSTQGQDTSSVVNYQILWNS